jgi:hypothetical protein
MAGGRTSFGQAADSRGAANEGRGGPCAPRGKTYGNINGLLQRVKTRSRRELSRSPLLHAERTIAPVYNELSGWPIDQLLERVCFGVTPEGPRPESDFREAPQADLP